DTPVCGARAVGRLRAGAVIALAV
ncbi:hypothetical protein OJ628_12155, partial [Salmonella enterica subsp. enterica]